MDRERPESEEARIRSVSAYDWLNIPEDQSHQMEVEIVQPEEVLEINIEDITIPPYANGQC